MILLLLRPTKAAPTVTRIATVAIQLRTRQAGFALRARNASATFRQRRAIVKFEGPPQ